MKFVWYLFFFVQENYVELSKWQDTKFLDFILKNPIQM